MPRLFDGTVELQKPPLYYWLVALVAHGQQGVGRCLGGAPAGGRGGAGGVLLLVLVLAPRGRSLAGMIAAVILATALHYTWLGRIGRIDMPLTFCVSLASAASTWQSKEANDRIGAQRGDAKPQAWF